MSILSARAGCTASRSVCWPQPPAAPVLAQPEGYPDRPVELVIPYPPGGSDTLGRDIADTMARQTGVNLVVVNVPGASTQVASRQVADAEPDGYTIYVASPPEFVAGPVFYNDLPFDPMSDFSLISFAAEAPYILLVDPDLPVKNYEEFEAYLADNPQDVLFGSYGALRSPTSSRGAIARKRASTSTSSPMRRHAGVQRIAGRRNPGGRRDIHPHA